MFKSQKGELSQAGEVDTIKNRASKLSHMDVEKWRKLKSPNGKDSPNKGAAGKSP